MLTTAFHPDAELEAALAGTALAGEAASLIARANSYEYRGINWEVTRGGPIVVAMRSAQTGALLVRVSHPA